MKKHSILDLKDKCGPNPKVAMRELDNGRWRVAILFPRAVEPLVFDRPTRLGAENEMIHQCRKMGYPWGYDTWEYMQAIWDERFTDTCPYHGQFDIRDEDGNCPNCVAIGADYCAGAYG